MSDPTSSDNTSTSFNTIDQSHQSSDPQPASISEKEAAVYDRQIRLWGLDAQKRLSDAKVLVVGLTGISAEVCKNIVLAGVGNIHVIDPQDVTSEHLSTAGFLLNEKHIGFNKAKSCQTALQELNPLVQVSCIDDSIQNKENDYFSQYDIVLVSGIPIHEQMRINTACRSNNVLFFATDSFGFLAVFFADLGSSFSFVVESKTGSKTTTVNKKISFTDLKTVIQDSDWSKIRRLSSTFAAIQLLYKIRSSSNKEKRESFRDQLLSEKETFLKSHNLSPDFITNDYLSKIADMLDTELSPVSAVVGGLLGQEIIKVISRKGEPVNNYFIYDGLEMFAGFIETVH
eukprot:gb/GECH01001508.1/.p1 GENE.gb/GECH01001508.1/~~gb/GECH01001508.1/.p1  ORF type:complete len:343 (+),score=89.38 gb/GECH01001508.1/:1-1029(+)